ncbi:hypothetical protein AVEN_260471-1 [Araneus ventricosus]|uniref:Uncharacterized protein n=1 Tax=Araneus ventricosus TaxID=182803 RepID=A0A4Y2TSP6_ARAVE|nr:hypothetical protein AVEN_260471-1 [Araneus ventricosus]
MFGSGSKGPQFYPRTATVVTRKNTQHLLSVPLLDGSTSASTPSSAKFKVYHRFIAQKSVTHFTAQCLHVAAHTQMGANNLRICTQHNYRFLDIQMISNKPGVAPVVHHTATILL